MKNPWSAPLIVLIVILALVMIGTVVALILSGGFSESDSNCHVSGKFIFCD